MRRCRRGLQLGRNRARARALALVGLALAGSVASGLGLAGCGGGDPADPCVVEGAPELEIGVPDSITFLDYEALAPGGMIPVSSNGQTSLSVQLAVRARNMGELVQVGLRVEVDETGAVSELFAPDAEVERFRCRDDLRRYLIPVAVTTEGLGDETMLHDKAVTVDVTVLDADGRTATGTVNGVLFRL